MHLIEFLIQIQFVMFMRGHPRTPIDPAPVLLSGKQCSMLEPAVNRQPGFRRGTRRAKQRRKEQPCWLAGWLPGRLAAWLAGRLPGWLAARLPGCLAGWLCRAGLDWLLGWRRLGYWLAGCWPAASWLAGRLAR